MPNLGPAEILVVLVIALLVFGPNRLPEVGKQVGRGMREFRRVQDSVRNELRGVFDDDGDGNNIDASSAFADTNLPERPEDAEIAEELDAPEAADTPDQLAEQRDSQEQA